MEKITFHTTRKLDSLQKEQIYSINNTVSRLRNFNQLLPFYGIREKTHSSKRKRNRREKKFYSRGVKRKIIDHLPLLSPRRQFTSGEELSRQSGSYFNLKFLRSERGGSSFVSGGKEEVITNPFIFARAFLRHLYPPAASQACSQQFSPVSPRCLLTQPAVKIVPLKDPTRSS